MSAGRGTAMVRAMRVHHWVKNFLIFLPLFLSHRFFESQRLAHALYAFVAFSLCASAVYLINDVFDIRADRRHPEKKNRPLASGLVTVPQALFVAIVLAAIGMVVSWNLLSTRFIQILILYLTTTTAYSIRLKEVPILDVMILASLYTVRIFAGAVAVDVIISPWFLAFSIFFFLNLAFLKRYTELRLIQSQAGDRAFGRGYRVADISMLQIMGPVSGYLSVLVFALYVTGDAVAVQYNRPNALWFACGVVLYWITHTWFVAHRGEMSDDPVLHALKDPFSYAAVGAIVVVLVLAALV